jgi:hypothetical protein
LSLAGSLPDEQQNRDALACPSWQKKKARRRETALLVVGPLPSTGFCCLGRVDRACQAQAQVLVLVQALVQALVQVRVRVLVLVRVLV